MLKFAKNHGNWFRHFEDVSRRCEPSNIVAYFFGPPCIYADDRYQCWSPCCAAIWHTVWGEV